MLTTLLALLLSQTAPTAADVKGALISVHNAQANLGTRVISYPSGANMACVQPAAGQNTVGAKVIRVGVVALSPTVQTALGAVPLTRSVPVYNAAGNEIVGSSNVIRPWVYGAMEVLYFAEPNALVPTPVIPTWMRLLPDTEVEVRAAPIWPACQVAIAREGFANLPYRCACSTGASCNWTPPLVGGGFGASTPAPKGFTISPGLWTGAGCQPKPCVVFAGDTLDDDSLPDNCR